MDNFMDKIAQKLGAQEAIRANAAADAAQIERLEAQVAEYNACIKEIRKLSLRNAENEQKLKELIDAVKEQLKLSLEENSRQMSRLVETGSGKLEQLAEKGNAQLELLTEKGNTQLEQLTEKGSVQLGQLAEKGIAQLEQLTEKGNVQLNRLTEECMVKVYGEEEDALYTEEEDAIESMLKELKEVSSENMKRLEELFRQSDDFVHRENVKVYRNVQAATAEELGKQIEAVLGGQQALAGKGKGMHVVSILTLIVAIVNLAMLIAHLAGVF